MKVNLHNRSRRALVLNLPYQICGELSFCHRQLRGKVVQMSDGSKQVAPHNARLSKSLTILAGETVTGLPLGVLRAPEVISALARAGRPLSYEKVAGEAPEPKAEAPEPKAEAPEPKAEAPAHRRVKQPPKGDKS